MMIISESLIAEKSSVPLIVKSEVFGIAFEMSSASPIALSFVLLSKMILSSEFEAQRKAKEEPTNPLPIIDIR